MQPTIRAGWPRLRTIAALGVLLLPLVASGLGRLALTIHSHRIGFGNGHCSLVNPLIARFSPISTALPPNTIVGYVTDDPSFRYPRVLNDELMYQRLAAMPVVIAPSKDPPVLVGDFRDSETATRILREQNLTILRDFGGGLMLLRRGGF